MEVYVLSRSNSWCFKTKVKLLCSTTTFPSLYIKLGEANSTRPDIMNKAQQIEIKEHCDVKSEAREIFALDYPNVALHSEAGPALEVQGRHNALHQP
jgi:hypothetical protein